MQSYGGAQALFTPPVGADASADPEWPGSVNVFEAGPQQFYYQRPLGTDTNPTASIQGKRLHQGILDGPYAGQNFPPPTLITPADTFYRFSVSCKAAASYAIVWIGFKVNGDISTFVGTYVTGEVEIVSLYPPGGFSDGRNHIILESCT